MALTGDALDFSIFKDLASDFAGDWVFFSGVLLVLLTADFLFSDTFFESFTGLLAGFSLIGVGLISDLAGVGLATDLAGVYLISDLAGVDLVADFAEVGFTSVFAGLDFNSDFAGVGLT